MPQGQPTKVKKKKKSVLKRAAQSNQRAEVNRNNRTRVRTMMKRLRIAITAGDATAAANLLQPTVSAIDQAISKGVLHENTANRYSAAYPGLQSGESQSRQVVRSVALIQFFQHLVTHYGYWCVWRLYAANLVGGGGHGLYEAGCGKPGLARHSDRSKEPLFAGNPRKKRDSSLRGLRSE